MTATLAASASATSASAASDAQGGVARRHRQGVDPVRPELGHAQGAVGELTGGAGERHRAQRPAGGRAGHAPEPRVEVGLGCGTGLLAPRLPADLGEPGGVLREAGEQPALGLAQVEHLDAVARHRVRLVDGPVDAVAEVALRSEGRQGGHEQPPEAGHVDALARLGGVGCRGGRGARHTADVTRPGQGDEEGALAEVVPDVEAPEVARDVVEVGERATQCLRRRETAPPGGRHPEGEAHGRGQLGHLVIVGGRPSTAGARCRGRPAVAVP